MNPLRIFEGVYSLCEAVADIASSFATAEYLPADSRDLPALSIKWAQEFEAKWGNHCWGVDDGPEYIDAIDSHFDTCYGAWLESASSKDIRKNDNWEGRII